MARKRKNNQRTNQASSCTSTRSKYNGLENQGATCYLNSILQVLFMTKDFRAALSKSTNTECIDGPLSCLFNTLQNKTGNTQRITEHLKISKVSEQDDAAECLEKILSCSCLQASQVFQGLMTYKNTCSKCRRDTYDEQPFWSLPLPLVAGQKDYCVMDGINHFFEESKISGENQVYCNKCKTKVDAAIKAEIKEHPQVLTLLLKRFTFDFEQMKYVKILHNVEVPIILQIPPNERQSYEYELYAYVKHSGELKHGHYTAKIKPQGENTWYDFNDTKVTLAGYENSSFRCPNAYLLFYRKKTQDDTTVCTNETQKNDNEDKNEQLEQDVKTGQRKVEKAAENKKTECSTKPERNRPVRENKESRTVTDDNKTTMNQKSKEASQNQENKEKKKRKPIACSFMYPNGAQEEFRQKQDQNLKETLPVSRTEKSTVCQDDPQCRFHNKNVQCKQNVNVNARNRKKEDVLQDSDRQTDDRKNGQTKGKASRSSYERTTVMESNKEQTMNPNSRKHSLKDQHQSSAVKAKDDRKLQERKNQKSGDVIHKELKYNDSRTDSGDVVDNKQSRKSHDPLSEMNNVCTSEEQSSEKKRKKDGDDNLIKGKPESCSKAQVNQKRRKYAEVILDTSQVPNSQNGMQNSEENEDRTSEKEVVDITETRDEEKTVEVQTEKMTGTNRTQSNNREGEQISLCNSQTQVKGDDSKSMETSMNNNNNELVTSESEQKLLEQCGESKNNEATEKSLEVSINKGKENEGHDVDPHMIKSSKRNPEIKCELGIGEGDNVSLCMEKQIKKNPEETKGCDDESKDENNSEKNKLTEPNAEDTESVPHQEKRGAHRDQSKSGGKGKKSKKGQNKQGKSIFCTGLVSPRMKNGHC